MRVLFYDDTLNLMTPNSIFLAGPTMRGVVGTPWRAEAIQWLKCEGFRGNVIVPEFRDALFSDKVDKRFGDVPNSDSWVPGMSSTSCNILNWETLGIEGATVVMFWMPFSTNLPGFTTRAEVSREMARDPDRIVLGMPPDATTDGHIRFHAYRNRKPIHETLNATVEAACRFVKLWENE